MEVIRIEGVVTPFEGNGRELGYPTANLDTATDAADGVYFGYADLSGFAGHPALIFIGVPTTIGDTVRRVEAHLLDFPDEDYYGQTLRLSLHHRHRGNQTFDSLAELISVMAADEQAARGWFEKQPIKQAAD